MRGKDLLESMEQIDDLLVEEAMEPEVFSRRHSAGVKWGMTAACVVGVSVFATVFWSQQNVRDRQLEGTSGNVGSQVVMNAAADDRGIDTGSCSGSTMTEGTEDKQVDIDEANNNNAEELDICSLPAADSANAISGQDPLEAALAEKEDAVRDRDETEKEELAEMEAESAKLRYTIISDYCGEKGNLVYEYQVPKRGEFICSNYLQETIEYYTKQENTTNDTDQSMYVYKIVIDLYADIEIEGIFYESINMADTVEGKSMVEQEYIRLKGLGYDVQLSEDFQLMGNFTKMEIDTFQASLEYGYVFRFANENDH